jgi:chemotaxis-related protein WspD
MDHNKVPDFGIVPGIPPPSLSESSADRLLRRRAPTEYLMEWEALISKAKEQPLSTHISATVIFRLGTEFLAIPAAVVGQVTDIKPIHYIPHQRGPIVRGLVNINGQLRPFVSMVNLLEVGSEKELFLTQENYPMMVLEKESDVWAYAVSEVCGIHHCDMRQLKNVPVNVAKSTANYLKGVFYWNDHSVGFLDDELLFFSLRKCLI